MTEPEQILKKYWNHDAFRPLQEDIINAVLQKKDVLALLPTGGGKSICFQVPALAMEGICLVVSPLIALMKDQLESLTAKGINALWIHSGMSYAESKKTLQNAAFGNYKFLYVSPERLETDLFREFLPAIKPLLIAVDEAHCISQWGYDFRPAYLRIAALREELPGVNVIALTASATPAVQADIREKLLFGSNSATFQQSFSRPNLSYSVFQPPSKEVKLLEVLNNVKGTAIVYCRSRKQTREVTDLLRMHKISADHYHAGLAAGDRNAKQEDWIRNKTRVIVCTNAFGMGIDKPDVRAVIHYELPDCLENYYQEAGRAGRDGKRSYAVLLANANESAGLLSAVELRYPTPEKLRRIYIALMNRLSIAAGGGEGESFDLDIPSFAQAFKLNILEASYGIKALAEEGLIIYNEFLFRNSTAEFIVNRADLEEFEKTNPEFDELIKGLLRSYGGIFDRKVNIYERLLANFIKKDAQDVIAQLMQLAGFGIITYEYASGSPQITLLKNRMYNDDILINRKNADERKKLAGDRAAAITNFISEKYKCRAKMIGNYFGDAEIKSCGICDNCIENTAARLKPAEFGAAVEQILEHVASGANEIKELIRILAPLSTRTIWLVLNFLLAEERIKVVDGKRIILG